MNKLILFCLLSFSAYSHGPIKCDDKNYYGECSDGLANGPGIYEYQSGAEYDGDWQSGQPNGIGVLRLADGGQYSGSWKDGAFSGHGIYKFSDGGEYNGNWAKGKEEGHGIYKFPDGDKYDGDWKNGEREGYGVYEFSNGYNGYGKYRKYSGNWKNGRWSGHGVAKFFDGTYVGQWENSRRNGQGTGIRLDGTWISGLWLNDSIQPTLANLGDLRFSALLLQVFAEGGDQAYPLGIMAKFLKRYAKMHPLDFRSASDLLISAQNILHHLNSDDIERIIYSNLHNGKSELLPYGYSDHAMGLKLKPTNNDLFNFEIFNSGNGLQTYHTKNLSQKYQAMLTIQVPRRKVTVDLIQKLLNYSRFKSVQEAYRAILDIPGAKEIAIPDSHAIWQAPQKSNNCSLEWIFAFLRNSVPESAYENMREQLYKDTYKALKAAPWPDFIDPDTYKIRLDGHVYTAKAAKEFLLKELEKKILEYPTCKMSASGCD